MNRTMVQTNKNCEGTDPKGRGLSAAAQKAVYVQTRMEGSSISRLGGCTNKPLLSDRV